MTEAFSFSTRVAEHSRARQNARSIVHAGGRVIVRFTENGAASERIFSGNDNESDVIACLSKHPDAMAFFGGEPLSSYILPETKESPSEGDVPSSPQPTSEAGQNAAQEPEGAASEVDATQAKENPSQPAVAMVTRRKYDLPRNPAVTETIHAYVDTNGSIKWPDLKKGWSGMFEPRATCANARVAIMALAVDCAYDRFHERLLVGGHAIEQWAGEFSDHACQMLRVVIQKRFGFDPGANNTHDAAVQLCLQNGFDPVCDYLSSLAWDGEKRLDGWLCRYLGADDSELNRAIGRLALTAAVRRARHPGSKFDQIIVLEGQEGTQKSTAIATLAGEDNFSDQTILGLDDRAQMERLKGKWLYEIADLAGMKRSEVEAVKAFASRAIDRARPAYGRCIVEQPRRCVLFATTNDDAYLKSQTGNRRFWPVKTGKINVAALRRDRDQLWAEAAAAEAAGEAIVLPERLWNAARLEQDRRLEHDPWDDILGGVKGELHRTMDGDEERIASSELLLAHLKFPAERATKEAERKLAQCMRRLGWQGPEKMRISGNPQRGYRRSIGKTDESTVVAKRAPWSR